MRVANILHLGIQELRSLARADALVWPGGNFGRCAPLTWGHS